MTAYATTPEGRLKAVELDALEMRASRAQFEQHVREAHKAGVSLRRIAAAAGLSHARIHQIVRGVQR